MIETQQQCRARIREQRKREEIRHAEEACEKVAHHAAELKKWNERLRVAEDELRALRKRGKMKSQSIVVLEVNNIKGIKAAEWRPENGKINVVAGRNGQGKTSMLIALGMLFIPKKHWPKNPVRHGEEHGFIRLQTENYKVELSIYTEKAPKLTVWKLIDGEFERRTSPRTVLDSFVNGMAFSVTAFNGEPDVLMELACIRFDDLDEQHDAAYTARTRANADHKAARTILERMPYYEDAQTEEVSVADLLAEVDRIARHNREVEEIEQEISVFEGEKCDFENEASAAEREIEDLRREISEREDELKSLRLSIQSVSNSISDAKNKLKAVDFESDTEPRAAIADADRVNAMVRANKARVEQGVTVAKAQQVADERDDAVKAVADAREERIRTSNMPLPGLGFDAAGRVTYDGVVFDDLSTSERIRVQLNIGAALNPDFRVITIEHGNDLDDDALAQIAEFAAEHDVMVLTEMVGDRDGALVIEAGEVLSEMDQGGE